MDSVHALVPQIDPAILDTERDSVDSTAGIHHILFPDGKFSMHCLQSPTGVKFLAFAPLHAPNPTTMALLRRVWQLYAEYVCLNPFQQLDMPIRSNDAFESQLVRLVCAPSIKQ